MAVSPFSWSGVFVIKKPWTDVMRAAQIKYPNPFNPNVLSIDVVSRDMDMETGVLHTVKLINSSWPMFTNVGELKAVERTIVDPRRKYMLLESNNVDLRGVLKASEKLEYEVHPDNAEWTIIRHRVSVDAFRFIAYAALSASQKAARLGREALNWVIDNRVDHFMVRAPLLRLQSPATTASSGAPTTSKPSCPANGITAHSLWSRWRFFLPPAIVAHASTDQLSNSSLLVRRQRTCSTSSLPASLECVVTSFDSFNPTEALGEIREKVATDVTVLRERLRRQCQKVVSRFSKVDEYVLIM
ncbi:unnamed protein product [Mesocestoides corti]|uniref:PRELI/MSF1 domain-containing protein n=1 Tax=Mesocestoides corti TaxID=53468 RepID=A0A158QTM4_MESCO|nr:unnamed protein product [Mesocestoides corti]